MLTDSPQSSSCELHITRIDNAGELSHHDPQSRPESEPTVSMRLIEHDQCVYCMKTPARGRKLRMCKGCMSAQYCDAVCQKAHWATHKPSCRTRHQSSPLNALGMPKSTEADTLSLWAKLNKWTIERLACIAVHRAGGPERFLRERLVVVLQVEAKSSAEVLADEGGLDIASLFGPVGARVARIERELGGEHLLATMLEQGRAGVAPARGAAAGPRYVGIMPVMCKASQSHLVATLHRLCRFRDPTSEATRDILEDVEGLCMGVMRLGWRLDTLKPGDVVAYPFHGKPGKEVPRFLCWAAELEKHGLSPEVIAAKTHLRVEELMRAYAALCY